MSELLKQAEVQSLGRKDLEIFIPHLTNEQKNWVTLEQFQTLPENVRKEFASYIDLEAVSGF